MSDRAPTEVVAEHDVVALLEAEDVDVKGLGLLDVLDPHADERNVADHVVDVTRAADADDFSCLAESFEHERRSASPHMNRKQLGIRGAPDAA